jgi:sugar O-acyltransferase (sialic acid O-acetyltransferase NeuD family)
MNKIAIFGAGGFGREVKSLIEDINKSLAQKDKYIIVGFYDDNVEKATLIHNLTVLGGIKELNEIDSPLSLALAVGDPKTKKIILDKINNNNILYPNLIHPSVIKSNNNVELGKGNIIAANNLLTCDILIKDFVILNLSCTVGHDTIIGSYCSFMPSVNVSGEVVVEEQVYVGTGATIINQVIIKKNTLVGAGALVSKSLPENCTAVGVPAKPIKFNNL